MIASQATSRFLMPLVLLVLCMGMGPAAQNAHPVAGRNDGSIIVTSETTAYCLDLSRSLHGRMQTPHGVPVGAMDDIRHLYKTGTALCQGSYVRAGIERLRRALVLLNHSQGRS